MQETGKNLVVKYMHHFIFYDSPSRKERHDLGEKSNLLSRGKKTNFEKNSVIVE